jgi:hypothetical protein
MTRADAIPYVAYCLDDAQAERTLDDMLDNARLVGWQCGCEPLFVAVWSYHGVRLDAAEAEEIATEYLVERQWFVDGEPRPADYVL